jgi:YVTN family beta-propeller protein
VATVAVAGSPFVVTVSPDGSRVYATLGEGTVVVIDRSTHAVVAAIPVGSAPNGLAFAPDARSLYVSNAFGGSVSEIEVATGIVARTLAVGGTPQGLAVAADGSELYVANESGAMQVVDLSSATVVDSVPGASGGFGLALRPDGAALYMTVPSDGTVVVVDPATRTVASVAYPGGSPRRVAFNATGTVAVVANAAGWVDFLP